MNQPRPIARRIVGFTIVCLSLFVVFSFVLPSLIGAAPLQDKVELALLSLKWPLLLGFSYIHKGSPDLFGTDHVLALLCWMAFLGLEITAWRFRVCWLAASLLLYVLISVVASLLLLCGFVK